MTGNVAFPTPPVEMVAFKAAIASYDMFTTDALDGGKKAISAKKKQREAVSKMATQLGHYVWAASNNDLATFHTSRFEAAQNTRTPPQPLTQASIKYLDHGPTTGQVLVKPKTLKGAVSYEVRDAVLPAGSTTAAAPGSGPRQARALRSRLVPGLPSCCLVQREQPSAI
jgi:hypothetical protein